MSDRAFLETWSLSFSDFELLETYHQKSRAWVGVQLLYFRDHGHFAGELDDIPDDARNYVRDQLGLDGAMPYDVSKDSVRRHQLEILRHVGFHRATQNDRQNLRDWLKSALGGRDASFDDWVIEGYRWSRQHSVFTMASWRSISAQLTPPPGAILRRMLNGGLRMEPCAFGQPIDKTLIS